MISIDYSMRLPKLEKSNFDEEMDEKKGTSWIRSPVKQIKYGKEKIERFFKEKSWVTKQEHELSKVKQVIKEIKNDLDELNRSMNVSYVNPEDFNKIVEKTIQDIESIENVIHHLVGKAFKNKISLDKVDDVNLAKKELETALTKAKKENQKNIEKNKESTKEISQQKQICEKREE